MDETQGLLACGKHFRRSNSLGWIARNATALFHRLKLETTLSYRQGIDRHLFGFAMNPQMKTILKEALKHQPINILEAGLRPEVGPFATGSSVSALIV